MYLAYTNRLKTLQAMCFTRVLLPIDFLLDRYFFASPAQGYVACRQRERWCIRFPLFVSQQRMFLTFIFLFRSHVTGSWPFSCQRIRALGVFSSQETNEKKSILRNLLSTWEDMKSRISNRRSYDAREANTKRLVIYIIRRHNGGSMDLFKAATHH